MYKINYTHHYKMSSQNNTVGLTRDEFNVKVSDAFDSRSHKKIPRIGCPHFKGKVKHIRNEDNSIEDSLCDIADNVEGKASVGNLENIGFWIETLYSADDNKLYKIKLHDNLPHGFNGLENDSIHNPLNMTHMRDGHSEDKESSEFGTGLKKALVFLGNSCEIYTRSIENGTDICWYIKMDFVEMMDREKAEDSYEITVMEKISYDRYYQHHNKNVGSSIIISDIRSDKICSYVDKNKFEQQLRDHLSLKFTGKLKMNIFKLYLNNNEIKQKTDVYTNNDDKYTFTFYINKHNIDDIVVSRHKHRGMTKNLVFNKDTLKLDDDKTKTLNIDLYKTSVNYWKLVCTSVSTYETSDIAHILGKNLTEIIRYGRNYGCVPVTKVEQDGYSNYISNKVEYESKGLNTYLGVSSHKKVNSLPKNSITSALLRALEFTTKEFRKEQKKRKSSVNSDDDMSVISNVSSITNSSVASKKKPAPVKPAAIIIPNPVPVYATMLNFTSGRNGYDAVIPEKDGGSSSNETVVEKEEEKEEDIEKEFNTLFDELLDAVKDKDNYKDAENDKDAVKDKDKAFGTSVPVSATQRTNLSVHDAFKMIDMMLKKEDLVIDNSGLDNIVNMYLASASSKSKLRIIQMLALEKYTSDDGDRHILGGAELVKMEKNL
jgi:hypothetical protein